MADLILPRRIGINKVEAYRARAEVTDMMFAYWDPTRLNPNGSGGGWIYDTKHLQIPAHPAGGTYLFSDPKPFSRPRRGNIKMLISTTWSNGSTWLPIAKEEIHWFADYIEILIYTGLQETWNTRLTLPFDRGPSIESEGVKISNHQIVDFDKDGVEDAEWD